MDERTHRQRPERRLAIAAVVALALVAGGVALLFARAEPPAAAKTASAAPEQPASSNALGELGEIASSRTTIESSPPTEKATPAVVHAPDNAKGSPPPEHALVIGRVLDAEELLVAGVTIEAWHPADLEALEIAREGDPSRAIASATTDVAGAFSFELPVGDYVFSFGEGRFPLPELGVQTVRAGARRIDLHVPKLGELEISVLDDAGLGAADVEIRGWSNGTGHLRLRTDAYGRASARYLPAGEFRVLANDPERGRGDLAMVLAPGHTTRLELPLRRRKTQ